MTVTVVETTTDESQTISGHHPSRRRERRRWRPSGKSLAFAAVALIVGYLVITPLMYLLWQTFLGEGGFTLDAFNRAYTGPGSGTVVLNTWIYAVGSLVLAMVVGTFQAYVYVRTDAPFKRLLYVGSLVPFILPAVLYAPAWVLLASPRIGILNTMTEPLIGLSPFNIYSMEGLIWVEGLHLSPLAFLLMTASFQAMDPSLEESARVSGASHATILRRITLPLARPSLMSAGVLLIVLAIESFEVPAMIGGQAGINVLTTSVYSLLQQYPSDYGAAGALGIGLLVVSAVFVAIGNIGRKSAKSYQTVTGKAFRPRPIELRRTSRFVIGFMTLAYFFVAVAAPMAALVYSSFLPTFSGLSVSAFEQFTWANYAEILGEDEVVDAIRTTFIAAIASATAVMLLTAVTSWFTQRSSIRGRSILEGIAFLPLIVPGMVIGLAISYLYLRSPIPIYGSIVIIIIAFSTRFLPFGMRYAGSSMAQIGTELEESAYVSGSSWWKTLRHVVAPLAWPGIMSGWIFVFVVAFRELSSAVLLTGGSINLLSVMLYVQFIDGLLVRASAIGVLMVVMMLGVVTLVYRLGSKVGIRL